MGEDQIALAIVREVKNAARTAGIAKSQVAIAVGAGVTRLGQLAQHIAALGVEGLIEDDG